MKRILIWNLILILSCGTETGNPVHNSDLDNNNDESFSSLLLQEICEKQTSCFIQNPSCSNLLRLQDGFDIKFGLNSSIYSTFEGIFEAVNSGEITININNQSQCLKDIKALSCTDTEVQEAFNSSNSSDYTNSYKIIPTTSNSCNDLFD